MKELAEESLDPASFNVVRQRVMQAVNRQQAARPIWWRFLPPALAEWRPAWAAALVALVALGFLSAVAALAQAGGIRQVRTFRQWLLHRLSGRKARKLSQEVPSSRPSGHGSRPRLANDAVRQAPTELGSLTELLLPAGVSLTPSRKNLNRQLNRARTWNQNHRSRPM